ncbi:hypothetical protein AMC87_CH03744 [Rhizobium phaseoli]|nr:hypothetical protein AMC87_CH03744 [Rhizobium phaseoli]
MPSISFPPTRTLFHHKVLAIKAVLHPFRVLMKTRDEIWSRYRVKTSKRPEFCFWATTMRDEKL